MDATTRQIESIFDPNVLFQVPLFQRPYVWREEQNWLPLWDDICSLLDKHLRGEAPRAHFLGAIVLEQIPHPVGSIETRLVIDGQQRFTTLQVFLIAARNLCHELDNQRYATLFNGLVENDAERIEREEEKFKLWPTNSDRAAFRAVHESRSIKELDRAVLETPDIDESSIIGAYRYFHKQLTEWVTGRLDDTEDAALLADKTNESRFSAIWKAVKSGLQLVVINLSGEDQTQVIFETLNARGTELLPADLIKNYLFRSAAASDGGKDGAVEKLYERYWKKLETKFWRKEVKQGRIKRPRVDLFISHYLSLMTREEVKSTHLFNAFKTFVDESQEKKDKEEHLPSTPAEHIAQLSHYADVFKKFYEPGAHHALAVFLRRLDAVDTATVYPFLLYIYNKLMPDNPSEFDKILAVIESFLMRRLITNYTSKNYNRLFVDLIKVVDKSGDITARAVANQIARGGGDSTKFPSDDELRPFVLAREFYGRLAQYKVRAVLEALDAIAHTSKSETLAMPSKLTIEHVMPQEWEANWPLGSEVGSDPLSQKAATERRETIVQTLGNLTLITGSLNPALSNSAWTVKRPELLKYSKLNLTQYFHGKRADTWDEAAITERGEILFQQILTIWPDLARADQATA